MVKVREGNCRKAGVKKKQGWYGHLLWGDGKIKAINTRMNEIMLKRKQSTNNSQKVAVVV